MSELLVLFDIDGTLLHAKGAGVGGFVKAGQRVFGADFSLDGIPVGGQLDPLILHRALERIGMDPHEVNLQAFRNHYRECLAGLFDSGERTSDALPGVHDLLNALGDCSQVDIGLLTGNLAETAELKLSAAGISMDHFLVAAWGDEGETRSHLPPVALERWMNHHGIEREFEHSIIIGDTIHDVHCGKANGCRVLAVCTGGVDRSDLEQAGADLVVDDLSNVTMLVDWIQQS